MLYKESMHDIDFCTLATTQGPVYVNVRSGRKYRKMRASKKTRRRC